MGIQIKQRLQHFIFWYIRRPLNNLIDHLVVKLTYREKSISYHEDSITPPKKNLCIFAHFDRHQQIDPYVVYYLSRLFYADCDIVFISACETLQSIDIENIKPYCKKILSKTNQGLDFASYRLGILSEHALSHYEKLIITNDSVYGPLFEIKNAIQYGEQHQLDIWGITDTPEIAYHLQSYFLVFSQSVLNTPAFKSFWLRVTSLKSKFNIIFNYEIGLSQYFLKKGLKIGAFCPYISFNDYAKVPNNPTPNPTLFFWDQLISDLQCPFIKRELLTNKHLPIDSTHWPLLLQQYTDFNPQLITDHLKRILSA